ncbi:VTT domain-containing protein [Candidatus Woesearchaeota archaeon]|nr:VTT domain-containing protein [Candidatus Woesearchaeota archaeon]
MKKTLKKVWTKETIILASIFLVIVLVYLLINRIPSVHEALNNFNQLLVEKLVAYGILGSFIISIVANASLILQIPYYPAIIFLGSQAPNFGYLLLLTLVSGVGMMLGEIISYLIGRGAIWVIKAGKDKRSFRHIQEVIAHKPKLIPFLIFLFACTPLPDDLIMIPLGMINYDIKKIILPSLLGKTLLAGIFAFGGFYAYQLFSRFMQTNILEGSFLLLLFTVFVIIIIYKNEVSSS